MSPRLNSDAIAFNDILLNTIIVLIFVTVLSILLIYPVHQDENLDPEAEFLVTASWDPKGKSDVDLWVQLPNGEEVCFIEKEHSYASLERDDLGISNDYVVINGQTTVIERNLEVITFRGYEKGTYIVNVHLYTHNRDDVLPLEVTVTAIKLNPKYEEFHTVVVVLLSPWIEENAFTFTLGEDGQVVLIGTSQERMVRRAANEQTIQGWRQ